MVAGRRRWLGRMQHAKALGLIEKIPTGRRRPKVRAAPTRAIARARGIAFDRIEGRAQHGPEKRDEELSLRELLEEAANAGLRLMLTTLDQPAGDNLALRRLQLKVARDLLSLCVRQRLL